MVDRKDLFTTLLLQTQETDVMVNLLKELVITIL